jgi:spoIIIJ-associated protein
VAHAEASARTVEAAVTAAAAQLGLRSDQVDVEVLEDPVPSTFGYIGSPARVRVTPRQPAPPTSPIPGDPADAAHPSPHDAPGVAAAGQPSDAAAVAGSGQPSDVPGVAAAGQPSNVPGVAAERESLDATGVAVPAEPADVVRAAPPQASGSGQPSGPAQRSGSGQASDREWAGPAQEAPLQASDLGKSSGPGQIADSTLVSEETPAAGSPAAGMPPGRSATPEPNVTSATSDSDALNPSKNAIEPTSNSAQLPDGPAPDPARDSTLTGLGSAEARDPSRPAATQAPRAAAPSSSSSPTAGLDVPEHMGRAAIPHDSDSTRPGAGREVVDQSPTSAQSSLSTAADGENGGSGLGGATATSTAAAAPAVENAPPTSSASERSNVTRPRRAHRDEPVDPEMVEADTERAGDFLEGLLDALDVDGDITTWVDEAGGHVDLEGSDLDVLVGSNGETLDALQELTRIAVLRQSKRRVRLLLDINGFRSRQRDQLISIVQETAERVIRSREDHEFQPMTPAERKIVHDAVAAIDGVQTESLGEDPYRRVVIRPT